MSTIGELGSFLARETAASNVTAPLTATSKPIRVPTVNGVSEPN